MTSSMYAIPAVVFCHVQIPVGFHQKFGRRLVSVCIKFRNADAYGNRNFLAFKVYVMIFNGNTDVISQMLGLFQVGFRQNTDKFLAAIACEQFVFSDTGFDDTSKLLQHNIARQMTVCVIDSFKEIQIHHQDGHGPVMAV